MILNTVLQPNLYTSSAVAPTSTPLPIRRRINQRLLCCQLDTQTTAPRPHDSRVPKTRAEGQTTGVCGRLISLKSGRPGIGTGSCWASDVQDGKSVNLRRHKIGVYTYVVRVSRLLSMSAGGGDQFWISTVQLVRAGMAGCEYVTAVSDFLWLTGATACNRTGSSMRL